MPLTWKDRVKQTVSAGGTGALTLSTASSGYQALGAGDDGKLFGYVIEDGTAWETGIGTYTHSGTSFARTARYASSTGSALTVTTAAVVFVDIVSTIAQGMDLAAQSIIPGGRLTLTTGVPVTTSDVTGATNVYYTPHVNNIITLWDGNRWQPVAFAEVTQALGTLTSGKNYDVFGYLSSGALATEMLVWTNDTTRATAVTLQDGRYCKSGDKTRLYLGTFRTTGTTTTEDSLGGTTTQVGGKRFLWNMYNRVRRPMTVLDISSGGWTYSTDTIRQANGASGNKVEMVLGMVSSAFADVRCGVYAVSNSARAVKVGIGVNSTTAFSGVVIGSYNSGGGGLYMSPNGEWYGHLAEGYNYLAWCEKGPDGTCNYQGGGSGDSIQSGLNAEIWA